MVSFKIPILTTRVRFPDIAFFVTFLLFWSCFVFCFCPSPNFLFIYHLLETRSLERGEIVNCFERFDTLTWKTFCSWSQWLLLIVWRLLALSALVVRGLCWFVDSFYFAGKIVGGFHVHPSKTGAVYPVGTTIVIRDLQNDGSLGSKQRFLLGRRLPRLSGH